MRNYIFTDLACEKIPDGGTEVCLAKEIYMKKTTGLDGKKGTYISFFTPKIWGIDPDEYELLREAIAKELRGLCGMSGNPGKRYSLLIVGLGNEALSPDALGPETVKNITVTRHLLREERMAPINRSYHSVSAIKTGVLANTGIETVELLKGTVDRIRPDLVIAIDSLAARSADRLATTIQLSDQGIAPGSGIGNRQKAVTEETVGVPVITIGVPTVVHSVTLIRDSLEKLEAYRDTTEIKALLNEYHGFFVAPKEIDLLVKSASFLLADAIDRACTIEQE